MADNSDMDLFYKKVDLHCYLTDIMRVKTKGEGERKKRKEPRGFNSVTEPRPGSTQIT